MCTYTHVYIYIYIYICVMYIYIYIYIYIYVIVCLYTYIIYVYMYTYVYMQSLFTSTLHYMCCHRGLRKASQEWSPIGCSDTRERPRCNPFGFQTAGLKPNAKPFRVSGFREGFKPNPKPFQICLPSARIQIPLATL